MNEGRSGCRGSLTSAPGKGKEREGSQARPARGLEAGRRHVRPPGPGEPGQLEWGARVLRCSPPGFPWPLPALVLVPKSLFLN